MIPEIKWTVVVDGWHTYHDDDTEAQRAVYDGAGKIMAKIATMAPGEELGIIVWRNKEVNDD